MNDTERLPKASINKAAEWLQKVGYSDVFVKKFVSEARAQSVYKPTAVAIDDAFKIIVGETPSAGITPWVFKNFRFAHPTTVKALKYVVLLALIFLIVGSIFYFLF